MSKNMVRSYVPKYLMRSKTCGTCKWRAPSGSRTHQQVEQHRKSLHAACRVEGRGRGANHPLQFQCLILVLARSNSLTFFVPFGSAFINLCAHIKDSPPRCLKLQGQILILQRHFQFLCTHLKPQHSYPEANNL